MFEIKQYSINNKDDWNRFICTSKNGTFLFNRDYMDYHSDKFEDNSLLVYRKGKLFAILPANKNGDTLYSHQGLTYGGFLLSEKAFTIDVVKIFRLMNDQLKNAGFRSVIYKPTPYIYHRVPAQEDLYALFTLKNLNIIGRNISSTIFQEQKIKFIESRKSGIRKAKNKGLSVFESGDYSSFWKILEDNIKSKYGVEPVHTEAEIRLLVSRFPENIKLFLVKSDKGEVLGGTVIYIANSNVVHTQYISANIQGKEDGALDLLFDFIINDVFCSYPIFDFGQSTEDMGRILNESLIFQKEGFGGRGVIYDIYKYDL